ncbi:MAG: N-acetylmuramoyl-L-alanine amidase [Phycisphaerae bacterium]
MIRVGNGLKFIAGAILICGAVTGCADQKKGMDRFSKPIFATKPPQKARVIPTPVLPPTPQYVQRPVPRPAPQPVQRPQNVGSEAGWIPPGGIKNRWQEIVLHHSATTKGGAVAFDYEHRHVRKWDELGYHFVIGNGTDTGDGQIEVGSRWTKQKTGAHCKTGDNYYNEHGIGICLVGNFQNSSPTSAQLASVDKLVLFLSQQCGLSADNVKSHGGVTHKTDCPGRRFPLAAVKRNLTLAQSNVRTDMLATAGTGR